MDELELKWKRKSDEVGRTILAFLIYLGANIAMLVVGTHYRQSCQIEIVPQFLQIGGGVMLGLSILGVQVCSYCRGRTCILTLLMVLFVLFVSKFMSLFS